MVRLSLALVLLITAACSAGLPPPAERDDAGDDADGPAQGRLTARPARPDEEGLGPGLHALDVFGQTAHIYVPSGYTPRRAWPLVLSLHGAGGTSENGIGPFLNAGPPPAILVAPSAVGRSWDLIEGGFGEDVAYMIACWNGRSAATASTRSGSGSSGSPTAPRTRSRLD